MRFESIAIMIFIIHIAMSIVNATQLFDSSSTLTPNQDYISKVQSVTVDANGVPQNESFYQTQSSSNLNLGFLSDVILIAKALFYFVAVFFFSLFVIPYTFVQFGVPSTIAALVSIPIYLMYIYTIMQIIGRYYGRSSR